MQFLSVILNNPQISLIALMAIIFIAWNLTLHWQIWQTRKRIKMMFKGTKITDLEGVIFEQIKRLRQNEKNYQELKKFCFSLEKMVLHSIQKVGVVRFNPFRDTGGDQSFCVCLLDAQDKGLVISSLFTREGAKVFTKPIEAGLSKYPLTEEEKRAMGVAMGNKNSKSKK